MPRWTGFIGGAGQGKPISQTAEDTVNLYVEASETRGAQNEAALLPTPGFRAWSAATDVGGRAFALVGSRLFAVMGGALWEFAETGAATRLGGLPQDSNPADLVYNGVVGGQLGIRTAGNVYVFTLATNTLSAALLTGGYSHLAYASGYGLAFNPTTGRVLFSALNDLATWNLGNFFSRSTFPDPAVAMLVDPAGLVWTIGTETFEVRYLTESASQPWVPLSGLHGAHGIVAPYAAWVTATGVGWLSRTKQGGQGVAVSSGGAPVDVTSFALQTAMETYRRTTRVSDAEAMTYQSGGHTFASIAFPTAEATWCCDLGRGRAGWARRGQWLPTRGRFGLWAPRIHVDAFGKHLVADRTSGTIWEMDETIGTEIDGRGIRRVRVSPILTDEQRRHPIDRLHLLMGPIRGVAVPAGLTPTVLLRLSETGDGDWSNELRASVGPIGNRRQRVQWDALGVSDANVAEVSWSDDVPMAITDAFINNIEP